MRRLSRWLAGLVSIAALAKLLSRRRRHVPAPTPAEPDPAAELRRKLDQARAAAPPEPATEAAGGTPTPAEPDAAPTVEERREAVHARAQEAIDEMRRQGP